MARRRRSFACFGRSPPNSGLPPVASRQPVRDPSRQREGSLDDDVGVVVLPLPPTAEAEDAAGGGFREKRRHRLVLADRVERIGIFRREPERAERRGKGIEKQQGERA